MNVELSPDGSLLVFKKGYSKEFVFNTIQKLNLAGLRIFSQLKDSRLDNIDFLSEYNFLKVLEIISTNDYDFSFLHSLDNLKKLSINVEGTNEIDFFNQINLEILIINWRKSIVNINCCKQLLNINLINFKANDLNPISGLFNLTNLTIKTASIKTLKGLQSYQSLRKITLGNCKLLTSISDINSLKGLISIEIIQCSKIVDYNTLDCLPALKQLSLIDCKNIESIGFLQNFPAITKLALLGNTNIIDGDLTPAKDIAEVTYKPRNHYNIQLINDKYETILKQNANKLKL